MNDLVHLIKLAAPISLATLKALGLFTDSNKTQVIDRSKLRKQKQKYKKEIRKEGKLQFDLVHEIYLYGQKDARIANVKQGANYHRKAINEQHYVIP